VPTPAIVTVAPFVPLVWHTPVDVDEKFTAKPDVAVAESWNGAAPNTTFDGALNVIVCVAGFTVNVLSGAVTEL